MAVHRSNTLRLLMLSLAVLGTLAGSTLSAFRARDMRVVVFGAPPEATAQGRPAEPADPTVIRSRRVTIDTNALRTARQSGPATTASPSLLLNLFDDVAYNVVIDRVDPADGGFTLAGHIPGSDLSSVTLASIGDVVSGSIVMPEAVYAIRYVGNGVHEVTQVDQSKFPPDLNPVATPMRRAGLTTTLATDVPAPMGDNGSIIDVLALYTPSAATAAGGTTAMATRINLGISEANTSYQNSGVIQRLRLVNSQQVTYSENNDLLQDLYNVSNSNGSSTISTTIGDTAASLRNTYGADLVMLITAPATPNGCGIAWVMDPVSSSMAPYGFSVIEQSCISPNYSVAHELGHNMGAQHDWYMDNSTTPYTYAHGYVDPPNRFRTVMSYNNLCSAQGFNCTRLLYWSNPAVLSSSAYGSAPMGIAGGTKSNCPTGSTTNFLCDADDHLTLNNTALTVANFRQTAGTAVAPSVTTQPVSQTVAAGSTATFTTAASGSPTPTVQWQVSANNGINWSNIGGATAGTYAFAAALTDSGKQYRAVFTNSSGSATTNAVALTVLAALTAPLVTTHPADATVAVGGSVSFSAAASGSPTPTVLWQVSTDGGATFTNIAGATATTYALTAAAGNHNNRYRAVFTNLAGTASTSAAVLTISGQITADPSPLRFAAIKAGAGSAIASVTAAQTVSVSGVSTAWTATAGHAWLQVTGGSGTGSGQFSVSIANPSDVVGASTSLTGSVTVTTTTGTLSSVSLPVTLTVFRPGATAAPFGFFDTPANGTTGMQGSFSVSGWALDDIGIDRVELWRDLIPGEPFNHAYTADPSALAYGKVFIGNPLFVPNARLDVEALYSAYPSANRGGWGYLLLSWGLWNQGNGSYTLYAFAFDKDGHSISLGAKTISVDNAHATKPFGSIDTPGYGEIVSGVWYVNFGWALTPPATPTCTILSNGVSFSLDSVPAGPVSYGDNRPDVAAQFPGFSNSTGASGAAHFDTTALSNGLHQIAWVVYDSCGRGEGIGSRFFNVLNSSAADARTAADAGAPRPLPSARSVSANRDGLPRADQTAASRADSIELRHPGGDWQPVASVGGAWRAIDVAQGDRVEIRLPGGRPGRYEGHQIVKDQRRPLPAGSSLDADAGVFYWQPAPGFLGGFDLVFTAPDRGSVPVRVVVGPSVRMAIDVPAADDPISAPFTIAGWAVDLASESGSGIDAVHVWAFPLDGSAPVWLGVTDCRAPRPDVGGLYGDAFANSAFSLTVDSLAPGSYDVVVYAHRARTDAFEGAQTLRITVR